MTPNLTQSTIDPTIPQVLLFGHSGAGKSALLGALLQAGETQGEILLGELIEPSGRLASIRDAVYGGKALEQTHSELTSYLVRMRPWRIDSQLVGEPFTIVLNDCSGKAAESLIRHPDSLHDPHTRAPVARAVVDADAIILLIDASADDRELLAAFGEFHSFLTIVAAGKSSAREVGGFPVFLVLTQCDKLAQGGDTRAAWEARVADRSERAWEKFHSFLKDAAQEDEFPTHFLPFGSIELMVDGVAVRLPRLVDSPGQPGTPFHVAELFRDCFSSARNHRARVEGSNRRLKWTLRTTVTFVAAMILGSLGMILFRPAPVDFQLADRVIAYRQREPTAAIRLVEPGLSRNKQTLSSFHDDPGFFTLKDDLKEFVESRLKEIDDYKLYRKQLGAAIRPGETRTLEDLALVEQKLRGELALPANYSWEETPAASLREKWLEDIRAIRDAENAFQDYYRNFVRRGIALTLTSTFGGDWRADVNGLFAESAHPPANLNEPLARSRAITTRPGETVLNRVPYEFERVYQARKDWETTRDRLTHLRDLADSLGLTSGPNLPTPLLVLSEPASESVKPLASRLYELRRNYTYLSENYREWGLSEFPDPGRSILAERLDRFFKIGLRQVQSLLRPQFGGKLAQKDSLETWRAVANALTDQGTNYSAWGRLLHVYSMLSDPKSQDPILELAAFVRKNSFELDPRGFDLAIPADLNLDKVVPTGQLILSIIRSDRVLATRRFKQLGDGIQTGSITNYTFLTDSNGTMTYLPGDGIRAEVSVRAGAQEFKLVWEGGTSRTYPFDLLSREPRMVKSTGASEPAVGVKMKLTANSLWPHLPALLLELKR